MLYDEVKKLTERAKLSAEHKFSVLHKTNASMKQISQTAKEAVQAQKQGINDAKVILIEDNKTIFDEADKIHIEQFRDLKFPFDNFFIEFKVPSPEQNNKDNLTMGLHVFSDSSIGLRSDNIYNICLYSMKNNSTSDIIALMAILKLDALPRFYIGCPDKTKCDRIINPTNLGNLINAEVCQRTERTAEQCEVAKFLLYGIKIIIYVVNLINSKSKSLQGYKTQKAIKTAQTEHNNINNIGKYIYIKVDKLKQFKAIKPLGDITAHRKSPSAHTRRGHYRHLKTGRIVWVNMSYVGLKEQAAKHKKIYKIK
jgi:hypothetical protein